MEKTDKKLLPLYTLISLRIYAKIEFDPKDWPSGLWWKLVTGNMPWWTENHWLEHKTLKPCIPPIYEDTYDFILKNNEMVLVYTINAGSIKSN